MMRIKIDVSDKRHAKVCLWVDANLVDYEPIPYDEEFENNCLFAASALRDRYEIQNTDAHRKAREAVADLEARINSSTFGQRGEAS